MVYVSHSRRSEWRALQLQRSSLEQHHRQSSHTKMDKTSAGMRHIRTKTRSRHALPTRAIRLVEFLQETFKIGSENRATVTAAQVRLFPTKSTLRMAHNWKIVSLLATKIHANLPYNLHLVHDALASKWSRRETKPHRLRVRDTSTWRKLQDDEFYSRNFCLRNSERVDSVYTFCNWKYY